MNSYKVLSEQIFTKGIYNLVPIQSRDRYSIMKWRNEQIFHLRQNELLTKEKQDCYFDDILQKAFEQDKPAQILFSYLENSVCIGYGGLVHINWVDKNAEISFLMDTRLEEEHFEFHWKMFLSLIEEVAFNELGFHKIFTYAFDLRPRLYSALKDVGYEKEARLKEHCYFNDKFIDVLFHSKINRLRLRSATIDDELITFYWVNDPQIRKFSFSQKEIKIEEHHMWLENKLNDENCFYYILENILGKPLGSIRVDINGFEGVLSYLIDSDSFGKGLGFAILRMLEKKIKKEKIPVKKLVGNVFKKNEASVRIFEKLEYESKDEDDLFHFFKVLQ